MASAFAAAVFRGCGDHDADARRAASAGAAVDSPTPATAAVESIETTLAREESLEACVDRERRALTPGAAEALAILGYAAFPEDVCRGEVALRARSAMPCSEIVSSALRASCESRVAVLLRAPDACPIADPQAGRDPLCLAWATRDTRMCALVPVGLGPRCRAVLRRDPRVCRELAELDRPLCESLVERYGGLLGDAVARVADPPREVAVRVRTQPALEPDRTLRTSRERALYLRAQPEACAHRVSFVLHEGAAARVSPLRAEIAWLVPAGTRAPFTIAADDASRALTVVLHGVAGESPSSSLGSQGSVRVETLTLGRPGRLVAEVSLELRGTTVSSRLEGTVDLPIGDLDPLPSHCPSAAR